MCSKVEAFCKEYFFSSIKPQTDIHMYMCMYMCMIRQHDIYMKQNLLLGTTKLMTRCEVICENITKSKSE